MNIRTPHPLEPVREFRRVETFAWETCEPERTLSAYEVKRLSRPPTRLERLQELSRTLWHIWLVCAGSVVGIVALAVLIRVAITIVGWSL